MPAPARHYYPEGPNGPAEEPGMATACTSPIIRHLRRLAAGAADGVPDSHLLARFVRLRDEDAFAALVRRHGPLVLGVGRRVLGDAHAADDCLQATFLVLA